MTEVESPSISATVMVDLEETLIFIHCLFLLKSTVG
jgi:hypothetical protein